jgi:hypothetical protein
MVSGDVRCIASGIFVPIELATDPKALPSAASQAYDATAECSWGTDGAGQLVKLWNDSAVRALGGRSDTAGGGTHSRRYVSTHEAELQLVKIHVSC